MIDSWDVSVVIVVLKPNSFHETIKDNLATHNYFYLPE